MNDATHFHLNGLVNEQNCHNWALEKPREPLHIPKGTMWCITGKDGFTSPYFFEDHNYMQMINNLFVAELGRKSIPI